MIGFVHIEKAAGTTINQILRQSFGPRHCDLLYADVWDQGAVMGQVAFARRLHPGLLSIAGHGVLPLGVDDPNIYLYTLFREPLRRCLSHYQYQVQVMGKQLPFPDWIATERYRNFQTRKLVGSADLPRARKLLAERFFFVGLVESFDESMRALAALSPYPLEIRYKARNVAQDNRQKADILADEEQRQLLAEANDLDMQLYAYVRDELYPAFLDQAARAPVRPAPRMPGLRRVLNRSWRNLVYKPAWRLVRGDRP